MMNYSLIVLIDSINNRRKAGIQMLSQYSKAKRTVLKGGGIANNSVVDGRYSEQLLSAESGDRVSFVENDGRCQQVDAIGQRKRFRAFGLQQVVLDVLTLKVFVLLLVWIYRLVVSPLLPKSCAYTPTCSEYMLIAIKKHGAFVGGIIGIRRILCCNPFVKGCIDPVPDSKKGSIRWLF